MTSAMAPTGSLPGSADCAAATRTSRLILHSLPTEVIERVLIFSDPRDVSKYAQTCRFARKLVYEPKDHFLWRELYLGRPFDDPRKAAPIPPVRVGSSTYTPELDAAPKSTPWRSELQHRIAAEAIAASNECGAQPLQYAFQAFLAAVESALPVSEESASADAASRSENLAWLDRLLKRTRILNRTALPFGAEEAATSSATSSPSSSSSSPSPPSSTPASTLPPSEPASESPRSTSPAPPPPSPSRRVLRSTAAHWQPHPPEGPDADVRQLRCRLRAYVALAHDSSFIAEHRARTAALRRASRCFVYDMRRYRPETLWGPYRLVYAPEGVAHPERRPVFPPPHGDGGDHGDGVEDGEEWGGGDDAAAEADLEDLYWGVRMSRARPLYDGEGRRSTLVVNWEHVEHILNVVALKLREVPSYLGYYKKPLFSLEALRANSAVGAFAPERPPEDWAGVTGTWRRFVCFMDYRDLHMFNYGPRDSSFFDDLYDEALRPVELHLSLISEDEYFRDPRQIPHVLPRAVPASDVDDPAFPTLYFEGRSRRPHASVASIRGKVSTLADGAVRWQFVTTYDGRMQWSAEAVQIGHVCSAAGIAGIWTGAHHERDDPAGPFWMVKVNDNLPEGVLNTLH